MALPRDSEAPAMDSTTLSILNPQPLRLPGPALLHHLVRKSPAVEGPALDFIDSRGSRAAWSYEQLHHSSDALASLISSRTSELPEGTSLVVPVLIPQCPALYVSLLAILKAGGAFCPLNLDAPSERVKFILGDTSATIALATRDLAHKFEGIDGVEVLIVGEEQDGQMGGLNNTRVTPRTPRPEDLAYVMYTSGSTGTPKGVGISHDAASQSLLAHDRHIPGFSRFLQFAAPTFDVSVFEIFFPLFRGVTLVSCSRAEMLNDLPGILREMEVDACELTPTVAGSLLRSRENAPGLRLLLTIGEMLTEPVVREFGGGPGKPSILWAMYGPTEATIHCTLQPAFDNNSMVGNIGIPLDTVSAYILDVQEDNSSPRMESEQPLVLPRGQAGELAIGGHQLANGYINRPEQTAAAFIDTTFGRLYRTGDRARITSDGLLECLGRISEGQVKLRGQRIELGEIEQAVLRTEGCLAAVASVISGILVVFCTADDGTGMDKKVMDCCRAWLPRFMVPGDVVVMREFSRLPSGKIDRKRLKSDYTSPTSGPGSLTDSDPVLTDELGRCLLNVAADVLGFAVQSGSVLSAAGMDSLLAIKYASALRCADLDVSALDVLNSRTLSDLHSTISSRKLRSDVPASSSSSNEIADSFELSCNEVAAAVPTLDVGEMQSVLECTPLQQSMLAETMHSAQAYCNSIELEFPATVTADQISSCFRSLAQHNEILRTGFCHFGGRFVQIVWRDLNSAQIRLVEEDYDRQYRIENDEALLRPFIIQVKALQPEGGTRALIQLHHAIYDGWSADMMMVDLDALLSGGQLSPRPPFRQICEYKHFKSTSVELNAARQYWAETLQGFQPSALPELRASQAESTAVLTAEVLLELGVDNLRDLVYRLEISAPAFFLGALAWLWSGLVGRDDIVLGTVTSGRTISIPNIEQIMGPCLEILPLRTDVSRVRTIDELLGAIHAANRSMLSYSFLPLSEIKKAAGIRPGQQLYDALFVYQESLYSQEALSAVKEVSHRDYLETRLLFEVQPTAAGFKCRATYHTDTWPTAQVEVLVKSFQCVVEHFFRETAGDLSSIYQCFPPSLLSQYNTRPSTLIGCPDLATLVGDTASKFPHRDAIQFARSISDRGVESETITYKTLDWMGDRIAAHLSALGVTKGGVVAITMEKSIRLYAGILGILKAGCAYLPLLPTTPSARITLILEQAEVMACLVDTATAQTMQHLPQDLVDIQALDLDAVPELKQDAAVDGSRIANIIYTSGSTGVPKGVCISNLNIASNLDALSRRYPVKEESRLLQSCSQAFDVSVFEIFFAWTQGMCLCSAANDELFQDLERAIRMLKVTHLSMTPTVAGLVNPANVLEVEFLVTAGEPMTDRVAESWTAQLFQGYGPSETTNICTVKKMAQGHAIRHLGHAFENTSVFVFRRDGTVPVPLGAVGELCFGGDQVATGYLNLPDLTSQKFIVHPEWGRIYRSGDLGRMLPDGSLMIIGRTDDQVKIRGQRLELNEINTIVRKSDRASECTTLLIQLREGSSQALATFYVPKRSTAAAFGVLALDDADVKGDTMHILQSLKASLPAYMVPAYLIPISSLPVTPSGKVDGSRLIESLREIPPDSDVFNLNRTAVQEDQSYWTDAEHQLADILEATLEVPRDTIGLWTPFPSLGLDSISAIKFSRLIRERTYHKIPISTILRESCLRRLASVLSGQAPRTAKESTVRLHEFIPELQPHVRAEFDRRGLVVETILPCTPLQEAMLASDTAQGAYVNKTLFRLHYPADSMRDIWRHMCSRHGILRTCFVTTGDSNSSIVQVVLKEDQADWCDFRALDAIGIESSLIEHAELIPHAINSYRPPVSFALIHSSDATFLSFVCHHALYDGQAISRLLFEVEQFAHGQTLDPAPTQEAFLRHALKIPDDVDQFWSDHLKGFRPMMLRSRADKVASHQRSFSGHGPLPLKEVESGLRALGVSLLNLCQASWACTLASLMRTGDVCFGNVYSGRSVAVDGIEELVAPCFNTVPIRAHLSDTRRNSELLKGLRDAQPSLLRHQFTPLRRIQKTTGAGRRLFDTLLLVQQPSQPLDEQVWELVRDDGDMDFPLVCEITPDRRRNDIVIKVYYDEALVSCSDASVILHLFVHMFETLLRFSSSRLPRYDTLPYDLQESLGGLDLHFDTPLEQRKLSATEVPDKPWTDLESTIRSVFSRLSTVPTLNIDLNTTIYQLGLDSINAVQVAALLREQGVKVSAVEVMEHSSCASLAQRIQSQEGNAAEVALYDLKTFANQVRSRVVGDLEKGVTPEAILPCTPLQCGMLAEFLQSQGKSYFNFLHFRLEDGVDIGHLQSAWKRVMSTTAMLRTGFVPVDHKDTSFAMVQFPAHAETPSILIVNEATGAEFDLEQWRLGAARSALADFSRPPWRLAIVDEPGGSSMHLAIHHALYDAYSIQRILTNISNNLRGHASNMCSATGAAVSVLMSQALDTSTETAAFWQQMAKQTVINRFPVMTPLQVAKAKIEVEKLPCSISFSDVEAAVKKHGFSIQSVLQAAWARTLFSYLGESSVVFGVVLSGRSSEATANTSLPCITTLPVIASNTTSNLQLVQQMMDYSTKLHKHEHRPLSQIQKWLGHPDSRLFDTLLAYQKLGTSEVEDYPWMIVEDRATVEFPVSMEVDHVGHELRYTLTFYDSIIPTPQAKLLLEQFDAILCHLLLRPDESEDDLYQHSPGLFSVIPAEENELPSEVKLLHQFVEFKAQEHPEKTALRFVTSFKQLGPEYRDWTYSELDNNGTKVASLIASYAQPGSIVAVCFDKCLEAFFAILGILKSGCSFVALDPAAPPSRKEFIVQDSEAVLLVTGYQSHSSLGFTVQIPVVNLTEEVLDSIPPRSFYPSRTIVPSDTCYCLYTSGTTGTPKGCEITHENAVQAMLAFQRLFKGHWDEDSRWLQFASFHFDVSVLEQYWTWSVGIMLVSSTRDTILEDLSGSISRLGITHIDLTPSLARLLHPDEVPSLCKGVFITGGEQLKQEILDVWGPTRVIHNFYGPTEATIGVTTFPRVPQNGRSSNIGRQFPNVGSYVFRPGTEIPVLRGGAGELCVSGKLVGKGYLHRDDLTRERFPTLRSFKERIYRTGDVVRVLHDGCFDFLGRADDQVKLRGQRLEIAEINHVIRRGISEVQDVATVVICNEALQKDFLVSFVVSSSAREPSDDVASLSRLVQAACRAKLPRYMVPSYVLSVSLIPLSANNKADVKELKKHFAKMSQDQLLAATGSTPRSTGSVLSKRAGKKLTAAFQSMGILQSDKDLSAEASIYDLGLDSISVLRLSRALKREGVRATPALILRHPIISHLVEALESQARPGDGSSVIEARLLVDACQHRNRPLACHVLGITPDQIEYIAPCSALQEGMISRSRINEHQDSYFVTFRFSLDIGTDVSRLKQAWQKMVAEFPILRTRFIPTRDGFIQVALKSSLLPWSSHEFGTWEEEATCLTDQRRAWLGRNQDVIEQPLELGLSLCQGKMTHVLRIFHALYDATSLELTLRKVTAAYSGNETGADAPSFLDALLHGSLQSHANSRKFWVECLKDAVFEPLPQLSSSPSTKDLACTKKVPFDKLDVVRKSLGVTHLAIIQALWMAVLHPIYQTGGVTVGLIVSGRSTELERVEDVIGPLFNTLPFYLSEVGECSWESLMRRCHEFNIATLPLQQTPLRNIQKWCSAGKPLFDTLLSFDIRTPSADDPPRPWTVIDSETSADYPLALEATLNDDGFLHLLLVAQNGVADESIAARLLDDFEAAAVSLVQTPQSPVCGMSSSSIDEYAPPPSAVQPVSQLKGMRDEAVTRRPEFVWDDTSIKIRAEMALLAGVSSDQLDEGTELLELGLDSIDTIKLSARLKAAGINLNNSQLIKGQSIGVLSEMLSGQDGNESLASGREKVDVSEISRKLRSILSQSQSGCDLQDVKEVLPPTPLQESIVAEMTQSGFRRYFNHDILELAEDVDASLLKTAWAEVVSRNPILRTGFVPIDSLDVDMTYCQIVRTHLEPLFYEIDLDDNKDLSVVTGDARLKAERGGGRSDLLQLTLAKHHGRRYVVLSLAHALYDGWSLALLHRDVRALYEGTDVTPRPAYNAYLEHILASSGPEADRFWGGYLSGLRPTKIRRCVPDSPSQSTIRLEVPSSVSADSLKAFCRKNAISAQVLGQACWAAVLSSLSESVEVTFGVVLSGRDSEEAEEMLFPTMNTIPVRIILHGTTTSLLRYIQENMASITQFQHYPLRRAQKAADVQGALFNTLYLFQHNPASSDKPPEHEIMRSVQGHSDVEYPICVEMEIIGESLVWRTACDPTYLSEGSAARLLQDVDSVLRFMISKPEDGVLNFQDNTVSVCGLPPVEVTLEGNREATEPELRANDNLDHEEWSATEAQIRDVLSQVSGTPQDLIGKSNTLYSLGLDSISAIKVGSLIKKRGIIITARDMLQASSIAEMAMLDKQLDSKDKSIENATQAISAILGAVEFKTLLQTNEIKLADVEAVLPATSMQVHMISVWQNTQGRVFFPEFRYLLSRNFGMEAIHQAWEAVVQEFPILRTSFVATQSRDCPFIQVIFKRTGLERMPNRLVVFSAAQQDGGTYLVKLRIHHALYDGVSLPIIMGRFAAICSGNSTTALSSNISVWEQHVGSQCLDSAKHERQGFWTKYFAGVESSRYFIPPEHGLGGAERTSEFRPSALANISDLKRVAAMQGLSMQSLFFAAYAKVLAARASTCRDVVFGIYLANRSSDEQLQYLPYPTLRLVPLVARTAAGKGLTELAKEIQNDVYEISLAVNAGIGLWEIKDWTGIEVDTFVNFLSLPRTGDSEVLSSAATLEEIKGTVPPFEDEVEDPNSFSGFMGSSVRDAYPDAVDVEVAMHKSTLDIGVFGARNVLGEDGASGLLSAIVMVLLGV